MECHALIKKSRNKVSVGEPAEGGEGSVKIGFQLTFLCALYLATEFSPSELGSSLRSGPNQTGPMIIIFYYLVVFFISL